MSEVKRWTYHDLYAMAPSAWPALLVSADDHARAEAELREADRIITALVPPHSLELCDECDGTDEDCRIANGGCFCQWRTDSKSARAFLVRRNKEGQE